MASLSTKGGRNQIALRTFGASAIPTIRKIAIDPKRLFQPSVGVACNNDQNSTNNQAIALIQRHIDFNGRFRAYFDAYSDATRDMTGIKQFAAEYDSMPHTFSYYVCDPTYDPLATTYNTWVDSWNAMVLSAHRAITLIFANANRELASLIERSNDVKKSRDDFESSPAGGGGVAAIESSHRGFLGQEQVVSSFALMNYRIDNDVFDADTFYRRVTEVVNDERTNAAITELDRLRDEYCARRIDVPHPTEFTQTNHCKRFSFDVLNTGDYSWAILRDILLTRLDELADKMDAAKYPIQLNSVYRNPARSSGTSRHQYGDAVDVQVFDFDKSGGKRNEKDWTLLRMLTDTLSPSYTEPVGESGVGHVHVDWRP